MGNNSALTSSAVLKSYLVTSAMIRLGVLSFLLVLAASERLNLSDPEMRFKFYQEELYTAFFILGFALNVGYLTFKKRFLGSLFFFRFQMLADMGLLTLWVFLTGGTFSVFLVIYILAIFFYGRFLGFKISAVVSTALCLSLFLISCVQFYSPHLWGAEHIRGSDLAYNFSLFTLALALISALVFFGNQEDRRLLYKVVEQEAALHRAEALKFHIFDWIDAGLMAINSWGRVTTINKRALEWIPGMRRDQVVNADFRIFFPEFLNCWEERNATESIRKVVSSPHTGLTFGLKLTALPDDQGWLILFSDITEIRKLENRILEMEKLATVGELAAGLAHEMKNPLAGIKASIQLLLSDNLEPAYSQRLSAVILRDIDRLDYLLKDFLIFARPQTAEPGPVALHQAVDEVLTPLALRHSKVQILNALTTETLIFDPQQLHQILINVCLNAFQAMEGREASCLTISADFSTTTKTLSIEDNGSGVAPELRSRCFDPFVTTKAVGTGLGLSIAQRLAAQNNAFLEIDAVRGGGTRVLLISQPPTPATALAPTPTQAAPAKATANQDDS